MNFEIKIGNVSLSFYPYKLKLDNKSYWILLGNSQGGNLRSVTRLIPLNSPLVLNPINVISLAVSYESNFISDVKYNEQVSQATGKFISSGKGIVSLTIGSNGKYPLLGVKDCNYFCSYSETIHPLLLSCDMSGFYCHYNRKDIDLECLGIERLGIGTDISHGVNGTILTP